ncbi:MAG: site-specific DNA-methyltransferase [Bifidobacteriaceae bacterium]|jgi:DNA modification methylase|nr:site-specific DNA-methyltransferase [Bifidobacteriaceae bacterium]
MTAKHNSNKRKGKDFVFRYGSIYNEDFAEGSRHLKKQNVQVELAVAEQTNQKSNSAWMMGAASLLKKGGSLLCICASENAAEIIQSGEKAHLQFRDTLIFENLSPNVDKKGKHGKKFFTSSAALILWFVKPGEKVYFNSKGLQFVSPVIKSSYDADFDRYDERVSQFQKPVRLYQKLLKLFTQINDTVLLLNSNGGSGIIAAIDLKRNYLAFEKNAKVYQSTKERIEKFKHSNN